MTTPSSYYHTDDVRTMTLYGVHLQVPLRFWFLAGELVDADVRVCHDEDPTAEGLRFADLTARLGSSPLEIVAEQTSADDLAELDRCAQEEHWHRHHPTKPNSHADGEAAARSMNAFNQAYRADQREAS